MTDTWPMCARGASSDGRQHHDQRPGAAREPRIEDPPQWTRSAPPRTGPRPRLLRGPPAGGLAMVWRGGGGKEGVRFMLLLSACCLRPSFSPPAAVMANVWLGRTQQQDSRLGFFHPQAFLPRSFDTDKRTPTICTPTTPFSSCTASYSTSALARPLSALDSMACLPAAVSRPSSSSASISTCEQVR